MGEVAAPGKRPCLIVEHTALRQPPSCPPISMRSWGFKRMRHPNKVFLSSSIFVPPSHLFPVRKAYKKRALQTHPDRAPASDKAEAEEKFREASTIPVTCNVP